MHKNICGCVTKQLYHAVCLSGAVKKFQQLITSLFFSSFVELKAVDIRQIYDKFPEKKGGLKELYDKGPQAVFFLVKFWVGRTVVIIFLCYEV